MNAPIRLGILIDLYALPSWAKETLEQILSVEFVELVTVIRNVRSNKSTRNGSLLWKLLWSLHVGLEAVLPRKLDAFTLVDTTEILKTIPMIEFDQRAGIKNDESSPSGLSAIRDANLDVLLQLSFRCPEGEILETPAHGIWRVQTNNGSYGDGSFTGFWQVYYGLPLIRGILLRVRKVGDVNDVLADTSSVVHALSVTVTRSQIYWKASALILQTLRRLWLLGDPRSKLLEIFEREKSEYGQKDFSRKPRSIQLLAYTVQFFGRAASEYWSRRFMLPQWNLLIGNDASFPPRFKNLTRLVPPPDRFWADPIIVVRNGRRFVFFEEMKFGETRGCISFALLDEANAIVQSGKVLEAKYHLSFPFIFEDEKTLYMIPETREAKSIKLFKCVKFPDKWEFAGDIMSNVYAVDSVLFRHAKRYWLFTTLFDHPGASSGELYVFHASCLTGGKWEYHPQNPVRRGVIGSRSAGAIIERGTQLYRLAQDGAVRYGHAIKIFEIRVLNETHYEEVDFSSIEPDWDVNVEGVHTLNEQGGYVVGDGLFPVRRWW